MKKKTITLALVALMAVSAVACGGSSTSQQAESGTEVSTGDKSSYANQISSVVDEINASDQASTALDFSNDETVQKYCDETKAIYQKLLDTTADDAHAEAQAKYKEAAEKMIDYLERLPAFCKMTDTASDEYKAEQESLMEIYAASRTCLAEGNLALGLTKTAETSTADTTAANTAETSGS